MARKKKAAAPENAERWMVSYADFMTLLFAVFVVLYGFAMSARNDFSAMVQGLMDSFTQVGFVNDRAETPGHAEIVITQLMSENPADASVSLTTPDIKPIHADNPGGGGMIEFGVSEESPVRKESNREDNNGSGAESSDAITSNSGENIMGAPLDSVREDISNALEELESEGLVIVSQNQNWLTIDLNDALVFAPESASILNRARPVLEKISDILKNITNYVRVRGYTDNSLVKNEVYRSNWELSAARSISVIEDMAANGIDPHRLGVEAYGQFAPFVSNATERGRARNRCVTVAISKYAMRPAKLEVLPDLIDTTPGAREQLAPKDLENLEIIRMPDGRIKVFSRQEAGNAAGNSGNESGAGKTGAEGSAAAEPEAGK